MNPKTTSPLFYNIRRSERAKNTRIVVKANKIEVVAPPKVSDRKIQAFIEEQQDWIRAAMQRVAEKVNAVPKLSPTHYAEGATVPFQGQQMPLRVKPATAVRIKLQLQSDNSFVINLPNGIAEQHRSEAIRLALIRWMKNQARHHACILIEKHAHRFALFPRELRIKTQKSRWGSCGPNNDINLNWLLMLAPPAILEYVIVHELCHIKHKNHSKDFWLLVAEHLPNYLEHRQWLKRHGASLMRGL